MIINLQLKNYCMKMLNNNKLFKIFNNKQKYCKLIYFKLKWASIKKVMTATLNLHKMLINALGSGSKRIVKLQKVEWII